MIGIASGQNNQPFLNLKKSSTSIIMPNLVDVLTDRVDNNYHVENIAHIIACFTIPCIDMKGLRIYYGTPLFHEDYPEIHRVATSLAAKALTKQDGTKYKGDKGSDRCFSPLNHKQIVALFDNKIVIKAVQKSSMNTRGDLYAHYVEYELITKCDVTQQASTLLDELNTLIETGDLELEIKRKCALPRKTSDGTIIFANQTPEQLKHLYDELTDMHDELVEELAPKWVLNMETVPMNKNNTGSKLFDLLIYAGGYTPCRPGTWIGFKQRDDAALAKVVEALVNAGESVSQIQTSLPYVLGYFPNREPSNWDSKTTYTPLIYALILRIPVVAEKLIELSTSNDLLIGDPLTLALHGARNYSGHIPEYKRIVKKLIKKQENYSESKALTKARELLNPNKCFVINCKFMTDRNYKLSKHLNTNHPEIKSDVTKLGLMGDAAWENRNMC